MQCFLSSMTVVAVMAVIGIATPETQAAEQKYPDVVDVKVQARGANRFDFDVTIASPYDSAQRYADAFRVLNADGRVYG